jgi:uncharacterized protein (DUF362 family)
MPKPRIVIVKAPKFRFSPSVSQDSLVDRMLSLAMIKLAGVADSRDAWARFFDPRSVVGIKLSCLPGKWLSTSLPLAYAVAQALKSIGLKDKNIIFWERMNSEIKEAGYPLNYEASGLRCFGTDTNGVGYDSNLSVFGEVGSLVSRVLTSYVTHHINLPLLKDHTISGLSGGMKNFYGAIHNPNKYHDNHCDPYLADVFSLPPIKSKNVLTIIDATRIQYNFGPAYKPQWVENYNAILVGTDPVAVDSVGLKILEDIRKQKGMPSLEKAGRPVIYLATAADSSHRLGEYRLENIEILEAEAV